MATLFEANFQNFDGSGFAPEPGLGQLDSDEWRVTGFSEGDGTFGGTYTTGDFARGSSDGGSASTGGTYAFDTGSGNVILGVQPGGSDFTPGTFTLKLTNTTGSVITDLTVAYDIFFNNDQPRSNSLNFAYSTDDLNYSPVSTLDFTTPEASDSNGFQRVARSTTLTGLNIAAGTDFFLQWPSDDVGGSSSRDEYGIDNILVTTGSGGGGVTTVAIASTDANAAEAGQDPGTFTLTRSGDTTNALTVSYTVSGTATNGTDYTPNLTGTATIAAGQSSVDITITPDDDANVEGEETVTLTLVDSVDYDLGATTTADVAIADNDTAPGEPIDLSTYIRIGRYNLPVPTRTTAPSGSQLALEASTVTYNPNTDTLFILGDEGTSIVQVTKTGQLIDSMTLTGDDFDDPEGLTYVSSNQFVLVEERERQVNLFTYVPGGTLSRADVQTVKLGTTVGNIGLEGISFDPQTGGYMLVKEASPQGIFQTGIDFGAGTATNGSPTTENSTHLFDPALAGLTDIADVYALSNLSAPLTDDNLLVLSQEDGQIVNIDRSGNITSSLAIASDPENPLSVAGQGHEGVTMDSDGLLYVVNEQGGGDSDHPQLWVYAPASFVYANAAPVEVSLSNATTSLAENSNTSSAIKVGTIIISDDALGTNTLSLTGTDAAAFEIVGSELFLKAGTALDFETQASYKVTVNVDDASVGSTPDASTTFTLAIADTTDTPAALIISEVAPWSSGNSPSVGADWFEVTNTSDTAVDITGWRIDDDSASFANSSALSGVTSIDPDQSVVFVDGDANTINAFVNTWFGGTLPSGVAIGTYGGPGLGTGGDAVNVFDATGTLVTGVAFGASPSTSPFASFDNAAGLSSVSALSAPGVNGAFSVIDGGMNDAAVLIGSPGRTGNPNNTNPIVSTPIADQTATANSAFTFQFATNAFNDVEDGTNLTYSATLADDSPLPAWLTFEASTRTFSGTPPAIATLSIKVTATDSGNAAVEDVFDVVISSGTTDPNPNPDPSPIRTPDPTPTPTPNPDPVVGLNINGTRRNDRLIGDAGDDVLKGKKGKDFLVGGDGDDLLIGGRDRDRHQLGAGNDVVRFNRKDLGDRPDVILDFEVGDDLIDIRKVFRGRIFKSNTPFDDFVQIKGSRRRTVVGIDSNGNLNGTPFETLVILKGVDSNTVGEDRFRV